MPFLTRDFAVFLGLVAFLVSGITATVARDMVGGGQAAALGVFSQTEESTYAAVAVATEEVSRESRVREVSKKVREFLAEFQEEPSETVDVVESAPKEEVITEEGAVLICQEYAKSNPSWQPKGLKFEVVEGALLVYRERPASVLPSDTLASTTLATSTPAFEREVVMQLPHRFFRNPKNTCISTDVIGLAVDGSLIRNSDYTAYRVFGSETLVGYALDGFAIYGTATFETDACGGSDVSGEYRYYLNDTREGVIGCFGATPVTL